MKAKELIEKICGICENCEEQTELGIDDDLARDHDDVITKVLRLCEEFLDEEK